ncbi:hypothetical protein L9F63_005362, partial [Diploptera punctata]
YYKLELTFEKEFMEQSSPGGNNGQTSVHAEEHVLDTVRSLELSNNSRCIRLELYSCFSPCSNCCKLITNFMSNHPNCEVYIAFTCVYKPQDDKNNEALGKLNMLSKVKLLDVFTVYEWCLLRERGILNLSREGLKQMMSWDIYWRRVLKDVLSPYIVVVKCLNSTDYSTNQNSNWDTDFSEDIAFDGIGMNNREDDQYLQMPFNQGRLINELRTKNRDEYFLIKVDPEKAKLYEDKNRNMKGILLFISALVFAWICIPWLRIIKRTVHAEELVLDTVTKLENSRNSCCIRLELYSCFSPCTNCCKLITNFMSKHPNCEVYIAFTCVYQQQDEQNMQALAQLNMHNKVKLLDIFTTYEWCLLRERGILILSRAALELMLSCDIYWRTILKDLLLKEMADRPTPQMDVNPSLWYIERGRRVVSNRYPVEYFVKESYVPTEDIVVDGIRMINRRSKQFLEMQENQSGVINEARTKNREEYFLTNVDPEKAKMYEDKSRKMEGIILFIIIALVLTWIWYTYSSS